MVGVHARDGGKRQGAFDTVHPVVRRAAVGVLVDQLVAVQEETQVGQNGGPHPGTVGQSDAMQFVTVAQSDAACTRSTSIRGGEGAAATLAVS